MQTSSPLPPPCVPIYTCTYAYTHACILCIHVHYTLIVKNTNCSKPVNAFLFKSLIFCQKSLLLFSHCVQLLATPWTAARQPPLSFTISQSLLRFMSIELVMLSNYLILCCSLLILPSIFPSIRVFSNKSAVHIRRPKYWSFSLTARNTFPIFFGKVNVNLFQDLNISLRISILKTFIQVCNLIYNLWIGLW